MPTEKRCERCGGFLAPFGAQNLCPRCLMREAIRLVAKDPAQPTADRSRPATTMVRPSLGEKPGDRIDRYKLLHSIGEGGMGVVYLAEQEGPVGRRVALKVIKLGMDTKAVIARFEAERQALARMDHPNIARVLDAGATAAGRPYFVMELVHGTRVTDFCDQNQGSLRQRLDLFLQICRAIQHAHQKGIIHRDLKPSNILVALHDGVPVSKIIDFGIAKATSDQRLPDDTDLTTFAQFLGTPAYMSPEQTDPDGSDIDTRCDVYSLGVLLYELLTGRTPFDADELRLAGWEAAGRRIREQEPLKPSTRLTQELAALESNHRRVESGTGHRQSDLDEAFARRRRQLKELIPLVRGDLDWIVMKALEKDRARRYETANGLALDLGRYLSHEPILARPPSVIYRFQKLVRRNQLAVAAVTAVAVALIAGLAASTWLLVREKAGRQRALAAEQLARNEAGKSQTVAQFLKAMLASLDPALARGRPTPMLLEILNQTATRVATDLASQPEIQAELESILGNAYYELEDYARAEAMHRVALGLRRTVYGETNRWVAASLSDLGNAVTMQDRQPEGEVLLRQALAMRRTLFGDTHAEVAQSLTFLADNLTDQHRLAEAEAFQRQALVIQRACLNPGHPDHALALKNLGRILRLGGRLAEAEAVYRELVALAPNQESLELSNILMKLTDVLRDEGKLAEAEIACREGLAMSRRLLGNEHPIATFSFNEMSLLLQRQGKLTEVEALFREHLQNMQEQLPADNAAIIGTLIDFSLVLVDQAKFAEAEPPVRECLALLEKKLPDDWRTYNCRSILGGILLGQKQYEAAGPLLLSGYEGMQERAARIPPSGEPYFKESLRRLVQFSEVTGRPDQAAEWRQKLAAFGQPGSATKAAVEPKPE